MKSFYLFLGLLVVLIAVYVFSNTNSGRNISILQDSKINTEGTIILKGGEKVSK